MELHSRVFKVALASAIGLFAVIAGQTESSATEYRYLCTSVPSACEYAPSTAPSLKSDVCWDGSIITLMPAGGCTGIQVAYYVEAGEVVDPMTNEVQAYVPLDDACDRGYCDVMPATPGPTQPGPLCCGENGCVTINAADTCGQELVFCGVGESAQQGENGEWTCYEES
jgi:hypothetical protein